MSDFNLTYLKEGKLRWLDAKGRSMILSESGIINTAQGTPAQFSDGSENYVKSCVCDIVPIQDLHGQDAPSYSNICPISGWDKVNVTRAGANLLDVTEWMARNGYTNYTIDDEGWITISNLNEAHLYSNPYRFSQLITGSVSILIDANRTTATKIGVRLYRDNTLINETTSYLDNKQFNAVAINYRIGGKATFKLMVNIGATHMAWLPASIQNVTIPLGQTVYGGTLDVTSGELTITHGYIASYNGETLSSSWISDRDVYVEGTTPTIGAEVCYKLTAPQTIQLDPNEILSLYGDNVFSSIGKVTVVYLADIKKYIDNAVNT